MAREPWMTDDQWECAQMFADVVGGFHHVTGKFKPFGGGVAVSDTHGRWATFDYDRLTRLVVLAHDRMIRVDLVPSGPGRVGFTLWKRHTREGSMSKRHPTMESAVATHRRGTDHDKAESALAAAMEVAVRVKPLEWRSNHYGDARAWISESKEGRFVYGVDFAGKFYCQTPSGEHDGFPTIEAAKAAAQADYERRILAALEPNPAAQSGRDALIAATLERAAKIAGDAFWNAPVPKFWDRDKAEYTDWCEWQSKRAQKVIRALTTKPQTDALEAVRREARAEGMRIAAGIAFDRRGIQSGDTWDAGWYQACATVRHEILDAAEREAKV